MDTFTNKMLHHQDIEDRDACYSVRTSALSEFIHERKNAPHPIDIQFSDQSQAKCLYYSNTHHMDSREEDIVTSYNHHSFDLIINDVWDYLYQTGISATSFTSEVNETMIPCMNQYNGILVSPSSYQHCYFNLDGAHRLDCEYNTM